MVQLASGNGNVLYQIKIEQTIQLTSEKTAEMSLIFFIDKLNLFQNAFYFIFLLQLTEFQVILSFFLGKIGPRPRDFGT